MKQLRNGDAVVYVDAYGQEHEALVTQTWGPDGKQEYDPEKGMLAINVAYVSKDKSATDQWGQQMVHDSSVVHRRQQTAHGKYWYQR